MMHFHLHIYFAANELEKARTLAAHAEDSKLFEVVKFQEQPVGPHPTGMIEAHFGEPLYNGVVEWIEAHRSGFSVLLHEDTGDDYRDHTAGSRWFGAKVALDFSFFELIQRRPELRINPEIVE